MAPENKKLRFILFILLIGLQLMTYAANASTRNATEHDILTDFTSATNDLQWYVQNDGVMGGLSQGEFNVDKGTLVFTGVTNTNGGGFSSIRTSTLNLDLSNFNGIRLQIKADGRRYSWQLQTNATWRGRRISYWADFATTADEWITVDVPFSSFKPQFRGMRLDGPELERDQLTSMGLYIYDGLDGPFQIYLSAVGTY